MAEHMGSYKVALTAATDTTVGGVLKLQNPEGADLILTRLVLDVTTASTGGATVDAGIDDDGDETSDNVIDGMDVNAAAGVFDNITDAGTNGGCAKWNEDEYLVITASATTAGMVGNAYIEWIRE